MLMRSFACRNFNVYDARPSVHRRLSIDDNKSKCKICLPLAASIVHVQYLLSTFYRDRMDLQHPVGDFVRYRAVHSLPLE